MANRGWKSWRNIKVSGGKIVDDNPEPASKYHNIPCVYEGIRFDSKAERDYYSNNLLPRYRRGQVKWFLRQVPFDLPGNVTYRADFIEFLADGKIRVVDVKGHFTYVFGIKKKQVEALYPVKIECVRG